MQVPFAVTSDGSAWTQQRPRPPAQIGDAALAAVACPADGSCMAVGRQALPTSFFGSRSSGDRPLAESWDGATWRTLPTPAPPNAADAGFDAVACDGPGCLAVGSFQTTAGTDRALGAWFDGTSWKLTLPPTPAKADALVLSGVSCPAPVSCVAVGHFTSEVLFGGVVPLIVRWNGTGWSPDRAANPRGSTDTELAGVDCPMPKRCVAVGFQRHPDGRYGTLAEAWDGTSWTVLPTPDPAGSPDTELAGVSCPTTDECVAVGSAVAAGAVTAFAESWDGSRWTIERPPAPAGATSSVLAAVACPDPAACWGAGIAWHDSPIGVAMAQDRTASGWTIAPVPTDAPA